MLVRDHIKQLREHIARQRAWINEHGGDLQGYIARYGDPDRAPLDGGQERIIGVPLELADDLRRVPGISINQGTVPCYAPMFGCGGTAIYDADKATLDSLERQLAKWELKYPTAARDQRPSQDQVIDKLELALRNLLGYVNGYGWGTTWAGRPHTHADAADEALWLAEKLRS
jgi:hypothetical protein